MNEITPPKLLPFAQSKLASAMLPTEQTNEATATTGPTAAFSIRRNQAGPLFRKSAFHQSAGTSAAIKPAIKKPPRISFQSIAQSIQKAFARRDQRPPPSCLGS